jgi:hypothetical protein
VPAMSCASVVVASGLLLDIFGVLLLWKFGLPPSIRRGGPIYLTAEQSDPEEAAQAEKYDRYGKCGIGLLVLGFMLQLVGTVLA